MKYYLFCFALLIGYNSVAKSHEQIILDTSSLEQLTRYHQQGRISDEKYLDSVYTLSNKLFISGQTFETGDLKLHLNNFYKLSFEKKGLEKYQIKYYLILSSNAEFNGKKSESLFFVDKIIKLPNSTDFDKLRVILKKIKFYNIHGLYTKANEEYLKNEAFITKMMDNIILSKKNQKILPSKTIVFLIKILSYTFTNLNDSINSDKILKYSIPLREMFANHPELTNDEKALVDFLLHSIEYYHQHQILHNSKKSYEIIIDLDKSIKNNALISKEWREMINDNMLAIKINYFLETNNNDSAKRYIENSREATTITDYSRVIQYELLSQLYKNNGNYKEAYLKIKRGIGILDTINKNLILELHELEYAYADAEHNKSELLKAEELSDKRRKTISAIIFAALSIIAFIFMLMKKKDKSAKKKIENLNSVANLQIAEMEEMKTIAIDEEKKKLGLDLHDGLASTIASVRNRIEFLIPDVKNDDLKTNLLIIKEHIENAYIEVRNKSHLLYKEGGHDANIQFEKRIINFANDSLPDKDFEKEILIDEGALENLSIDDKIEIIKITQEAITNIIKHSKASKVSILIYEDHGYIFFNIKDNGKGFKTENQEKLINSLGLHSIKSRAHKLGGKANFNSNSQGTEIDICFPTKNL